MAKNMMAIARAKALKGGSGSLSRGIPAESLLIKDVVREDPFKSLFAIRERNLADIKKNIQKKGFDESKTVDVWKRQSEEGAPEYVLVDGFTRVMACQQLGLLTVMAYIRSFEDTQEALAFAIHQQTARRNLSDAEQVRVIEALDVKKKRGRPLPLMGTNVPISKGRSADLTAEAAGGGSRRKVQEVRALAKDPKLRQKVLAGQMSIHKAAVKIAAKQKPSKAAVSKLQAPTKTAKSIILELSRAEADETLTALSTKPSALRRK